MPVHAATCLRLGNRERGIEDRYARRCFRIAAGHLLVRLFVGDQGERLAFAAGAGGGRHRDQREHRLGCFAHTPIILHSAAVG